MSKSQFEKAVEIVQGLPKDGPIKPSQDDQLFVRVTYFFLSINDEAYIVLQVLQTRCSAALIVSQLILINEK